MDRTPPNTALRPSRRRALALIAAPLVSLATITGCRSFDEKQREWVFGPRKEDWWGGTAAAAGMSDVWIEFDSKVSGKPVRLHGLWLASARPGAPVLLFLHGSRWNLSGSAPRIRRMQELGFSVLGIDYRGFGRSTDVLPSEDMAYEDADQAWQWLARQYANRPRYVFGHSLGAAIAVQVAATNHDVSGLIVEGSFPSIADVARSMKYGWVPVSWLLTQRFDAESRIAAVKAPSLFVHGSDDTLIPPKLGEELFARANGPKKFVLVDGGTHHNTMAVGLREYRGAIHDLFGLPMAQLR